LANIEYVKVQPHSDESETRVIGSILKDYEYCTMFISKIKPEFFYKENNRLIFNAEVHLHESGIPVEEGLLIEELKKEKILEKIGGAYFITGLYETTISAANIQYYIKILEEKYHLRRQILIGNSIIEKAYEPSANSEEINNLGLTEFLNLDKDKEYKKIVSSGNISERRKSGLIERLSGKFVKTYFNSLDSKLSLGYSPTHTSTIFGRTRHGKSALKANFTVNQCRNNFGVLHITPEQGFDIEMDRLTSIITGIPLIEILKIKDWAKFVDGKIITERKEILNKIKQTSDEINSWNIHFHSGTVSLPEIRKFVLDTKMKFGLDIVYIDLFDRIEEIRNETSYKVNMISKCLSFVEKLAEEADVHICNIVQARRETETRADKRPTLEDLKGCGSFEEDSWLILSVFREHLAKKEVADDSMEISILKQKNGPEGIIELMWDNKTLALSEDIF
jgi:replicative DNA helicase